MYVCCPSQNVTLLRPLAFRVIFPKTSKRKRDPDEPSELPGKFYRLSPMEGAAAKEKRLTIKDLDQNAWNRFKEFKENLKKSDAITQYVLVRDLLAKYDPGHYKQYPRGTRAMLKLACKRISVEALLKDADALATEKGEAWAVVVTRIKHKQRMYSALKRAGSYRRYIKPSNFYGTYSSARASYSSHRRRKVAARSFWYSGGKKQSFAYRRGYKGYKRARYGRYRR